MYLSLKRYSRPSSAAECLHLLGEPGQVPALLAGGTDLNAGGHEDITHVIDLQGLPLDGVEETGGLLRLGARVTLGRLRRHEALAAPLFSALREAAGAYAVLALQNRATLGGRVVSERADLDVPPALLALGARLKLLRLDGDRVVESEIDYPTGAARSALKGALIAEIVIPGGDGTSALRRFGRTAVDVPLATCAAVRRGHEVRLAANLQGPSAADLRRLTRTESLMNRFGGNLPSDWRRRIRATLLAELAAHTDPWASGEYRRDLTATLAVRALAAVSNQAEIVKENG